MHFLPRVTGLGSTLVLLALFGMVRSQSSDAQLNITSSAASTRWAFCDGHCDGRMQLVDVIINNTGTSNWLTSNDGLQISIESRGFNTVRSAVVKRLPPGGSSIVQVGVQNRDGIPIGSQGSATAIARWGNGQTTSLEFNATFGIPTWSPTAESVNNHQAPDWFRGAKYGIFIHWGVYSVPAYGGTGSNESYAEWYWHNQMDPSEKSQTYQYHLQKYGPNVVYDDFIANFTVDHWDPKAWVDLISNAGARYFVPTTKHHEGFALFDMPSNVSNRNSVKLGPRRDLIRELFDAAKTYQPHLHRGTYFSMPEWYNPAYLKYANGDFGQSVPKNPYNNSTVPYTGYVEVDDFLPGIQFPQMEILAYNYDTEIMWCDIGGPSLAINFTANWLNWAFSQQKDVTLNNRCGYAVSGGNVNGDYNTPEYAPSTSLSPQPWEACRGMDPFSFGYNAMTPDSAYISPVDIVTTLVDIVSKNGNLLLDIGPMADGSIKEIMETNLLAAGRWITAHGESIYDTKYWPSGSGSGSFRYTTTDDAFYIHTLTQPKGNITITDAVPYLPGDRITVVGGSKNGSVVSSELVGKNLVLSITDEIASADNYTWTFKITY